MPGIMASIGHNLRSLTRFSGRDTRGQFWPWAIVLFLLSGMTCALIMLPERARSMARMHQFAMENPEQATVSAGPGHYSIQIEGYHPELMPDFRYFLTPIMLMMIGVVALIAAAVVRRLHDRDRSGLWGLLPIPFMGIGFVVMPSLFGSLADGGPPNVGLFLALFVNNLLYLFAVGFLIVLLVGEGTAGPNRYGPNPVDRVEA